MKVAIIAGFAPSLINFRGPLLQALVTGGHSVVATAAEADSSVSKVLARWGIIYQPIPFNRSGLNPWSDLRYGRHLQSWLRYVQPDVVLAYTHKPVIHATLAAARLPRIPKVFPLITGLGFAFHDGGGWRKILARYALTLLYRRASRYFAGVLFQNPDDAALFYQRKLVRPGTPVCIVRGSGIDLTRFTFQAQQVGTPSCLLIARLLGDKGIREYVAAARLLRRDFPDVKFDLIGPTDPSPSAIKLSEINGWVHEQIIRYHGAQADVRPFLRRCNIYVLPSYREGTPRTVLEAMATGRAIVTTDAAGCRETIFNANVADAGGVRQGDNGLLVPVKSVVELATAMRQLIENPALSATMGKAGRHLVKEHYDVHKVNRRILTFLGISKFGDP